MTSKNPATVHGREHTAMRSPGFWQIPGNQSSHAGAAVDVTDTLIKPVPRHLARQELAESAYYYSLAQGIALPSH